MLPLLLIGCASGDFLLEVEQSAQVGTIHTLRWQAPGQGEARVEVAEDGAWSQSQAAAGGEHVLVGLQPERSYQLRVRVGDWLSEVAQVETPAAPALLPSLQAETLDDAARPLPLVTGLGSSSAAAIIVDGEGELTWWHEAPALQTVGRVRPTADGTGLWIAPINVDEVEQSPLLKVSWTGQVLDERVLPWGHHDFLELPDGTIAYLAYAPGDLHGHPISGGQVVELHPDGGATTVFDVAEALGQDISPDLLDELWPHANALDFLPDQDAYLVSLMSLDAVLRIDRATGAVDWVLGGPLSTLADSSGDTRYFDAQHQLQWTDDGLLVFVNGTSGDSASRVVQVELDPQAGLATETWRYQPGLESPVFGDVRRDDEGHTRVLFSFAGEAHELSGEGELLWRLQSELGGAMTYAVWLEPFFEEL